MMNSNFKLQKYIFCFKYSTMKTFFADFFRHLFHAQILMTSPYLTIVALHSTTSLEYGSISALSVSYAGCSAGSAPPRLRTF